MPKKKNNDKFYLVLSKDKNYKYGAFPYSKEGLEAATEFKVKIEKEHKQKLYIAEK